jgi:hypothetical protein
MMWQLWLAAVWGALSALVPTAVRAGASVDLGPLAPVPVPADNPMSREDRAGHAALFRPTALWGWQPVLCQLSPAGSGVAHPHASLPHLPD